MEDKLKLLVHTEHYSSAYQMMKGLGYGLQDWTCITSREQLMGLDRRNNEIILYVCCNGSLSREYPKLKEIAPAYGIIMVHREPPTKINRTPGCEKGLVNCLSQTCGCNESVPYKPKKKAEEFVPWAEAPTTVDYQRCQGTVPWRFITFLLGVAAGWLIGEGLGL